MRRTLSWFIVTLLCTVTAAGCSGVPASRGGSPPFAGAASELGLRPSGPHASQVTVVVMENRNYARIIGNSNAPYINGQLVPQAALMTNSHAVSHPSQPNYLALFSGSTQGTKNDRCPRSFAAPNLAQELIAAGLTFAGYSESMPRDGYKGCFTNLYDRDHNPWVDFTNVPAASNLVYNGFPSVPPTVAIIVPNLCDDMHNCSTSRGDTWLSTNLPPILQWDAANDALLILTWDEAAPDNSGKNAIATLLIGPMVTAGQYGQNVNHYDVLNTIETIAGVPCTANACSASGLAGMWK